VRLLLDENVSPNIVQALRTDGHDVVHVRDRGWLSEADHVLWRHAVDDGRTFVTINARDFRRLAATEQIHAGLITFPSGEPPSSQLAHIRRGVVAAEAAGGVNALVRVEGDLAAVTVLPELR